MDLLVLNRKFESVFILDKYESIIWTDRFSSYGDFEIYTSTDPDLFKNLQEDYYLWSADSEHMMIIEEWKTETDVEMGNHLTVTGRSLESILDRRIVWKQTNLNGKIEDQIKRLLDENVINPTDSNRKISNFIFEYSGDPYIDTLTIQAQFTGDVLYDAIKNLCDSVEIGFMITLNNNNQFVFKLYSGINRSYDQNDNPYVVFSPNFENIVNSNYFKSKKEFKNVTLVAGEGEGDNRKTVVVGETKSKGLDRRELFTDARDISSTTSDGDLSSSQYNYLLSQRGYENLSENKIQQAFDGEVEATQMYRYGEHFFMGDIVQLENEYEMQSKVRIIEFISSEDKNGFKNYPTFEILEEE